MVPKPTPRPFVLHKFDIDAQALEHFPDDEPKRATRGGWRTLFSSPDTPTDSLNIGIARWPPRTSTQDPFAALALHRHKQAEFYYILKGQARVQIEGVDHNVGPGAALFIPGDGEHGFWNTSDEEELVILYGFACNSFKEVVYRFSGDKDGSTSKRAAKL